MFRKTWNLCTGFKYGKLYLLNDSMTKRSSQEYAAVREGRQIDVFTMRSLDADTLANRVYILEMHGSGRVDCGPVEILLHEEGPCEHCS
jgi:hypothetical protein